MSFTVQHNRKETNFSSKDHAIRWMDHLQVDTKLWICNTLLRSRVKQADNTFDVVTYNYDSGRQVGTIQ